MSGRFNIFKLILIVGIFSLLTAGIYAEPVDITDPNNNIYRVYEQWRDARLIKSLPHIMPYPLQIHRALLSEVLANPKTPDSEKIAAQEYLEFVSAEKTPGISYAGSELLMQPYYSDNLYGEAGAGAYAGGYLTEDTSLAIHFLTFGKDATHPNPQIDTFEDNADITIKGRTIDLRQSFSSLFAIGDRGLYFQSGISRVSLSPTFDTNGVLSGQASHLPEFSLLWNTDNFSLSNTYLELTATNYLGEDDFSGKHMFVQTMSWRTPIDGLELYFYQTAVWGGRFDLRYLVPFSYLMYNQSFSGFEDNSLMGGALEYHFGPALSFRSAALVDDADLNRLVRFDFGGKNKMVWENELTWTPLHPFLRSVDFSYTMVTPYMYTHRGDRFEEYDPAGDMTAYYEDILLSEPNYQNYTHFGDSLGAQMDPNSDLLSLKYRSMPLPGFLVLMRGSFSRHGNATDDLNGDFLSNPSVYTEEGGLFDDGYNDEPYAAFNDGVGFLTQDILEYTVTIDLSLGYVLKLNSHEIAATVGAFYTNQENSGFIKGETTNDIEVLISLLYRYRFY